MPRARKFRVRRNLSLTKDAAKDLREWAKESGQAMSDVVSRAIVEHVRVARAAKWQAEQGLDAGDDD